jgi:hypothetical protein
MKHISYITSAMVFSLAFIVFGTGAWWVWNAIPWLYPILGTTMLICGTGFVLWMFFSKGRAMWIIDRNGVPKQVARRASPTKVDGPK